MREITDEQGNRWQAVAVPSEVAHRKLGATLGFRPAEGSEEDTILTPVTFNSMKAAEGAVRSMGEKELLRRLSLARAAAGHR